MNVVHIAGQPVRIGKLLRQRCGWCGEMMIDVDLGKLTIQVKAYEPGELYEGGPEVNARADGFDLRPLKLESGGLPQTACVFRKPSFVIPGDPTFAQKRLPTSVATWGDRATQLIEDTDGFGEEGCAPVPCPVCNVMMLDAYSRTINHAPNCDWGSFMKAVKEHRTRTGQPPYSDEPFETALGQQAIATLSALGGLYNKCLACSRLGNLTPHDEGCIVAACMKAVPTEQKT